MTVYVVKDNTSLKVAHLAVAGDGEEAKYIVQEKTDLDESCIEVVGTLDEIKHEVEDSDDQAMTLSLEKV